MAEDGGDAAKVAIGVDEGRAFSTILALPSDGGTGIGLLQMNRLRIPIPAPVAGAVFREVGFARCTGTRGMIRPSRRQRIMVKAVARTLRAIFFSVSIRSGAQPLSAASLRHRRSLAVDRTAPRLAWQKSHGITNCAD